ncbi:MAG: nucleoside-diphosphate kinase [Chlamydiales bacterium]|nr:nucleoside-diphosphate kinase [Chlamydiales bacterium]
MTLLAADQTFSMIKPTAVKEHHIGGIIDLIEKANLSIADVKMQQLTKEQAEAFYAEHKGKPFFGELVSMMSSGPVVLMVVEGDNAQAKLRDIIGSTDPKKASPGTIRASFGKSVTENAIHGSDSPESAKREIAFFFAGDET